MQLRELYVQAGDDVRQAWERLLAYERTRRVVRGAGITTRQMPDGLHIRAEAGGGSRHFRHPWRPQISADLRASLRPGTVNGVYPTIEGIGLDGRDADGAEAPVPPLDLTEEGPDEQGRSWLVLVALSVTSVEAAYTVEARRDLAPRSDQEGVLPLVYLTWRARTTILARHQIAHHHLRHAARGAGHYFWAV